MSRIAKALDRAKESRRQKKTGTRPPEPFVSEEKIIGSNQVFATEPEKSLKVQKLNFVEFNTNKLGNNRVTMENTGKAAASAYNMLRTRLVQRLRSNNWHRVAVSSASASDGKSLTAINLAISMARPGDRRVVLIDFDLVNPSIQRYLGITGYEKCLGDYIVGDAKPSEILYATPVENLWVVPNNLPITNSSEALGSKRTLELIEWIQSADPSCIILMDLPPLLVSDDVLAASGFTDALLLVIAEGRTSRESVRNTKELIEDHEIELLGVVINESRDKIATYKY